MGIVTNDKSLIYRYHQRPTVDESIQNNLYCKMHFPAIKKVRCGRMTFCPACKGKQISLPSGKPIK